MEKLKPPIIIGNWKMHKTVEDAFAFLEELLPEIENTSSTVGLAVPFTAIALCVEKVKTSKVLIGAQNMSDASEGAFTGEIAAMMLKEAGASFVLLGHSERRSFFQETNDFIQKKVKKALREEILPVLCVGETKEERKEGKTREVLETQIRECLLDISLDQSNTLLLAYEPVWAIGTKVTVDPEVAEEALLFCFEILQDLYGKTLAKSISILYGGSVSPENAPSLLKMPNASGLLVGGASLSSESFSQIIKKS